MKKFKFYYNGVRTIYAINLASAMLTITKEFKDLANLKPTDIYNFTFADTIKIQDQHYRVNKIEYNTDKNTLAKLELLRI